MVCDIHAQTMPHFTLIAKDNLAVKIVEDWIKNARFVGVADEKIEQAEETVRAMKQWRKENKKLCKNPD